jgi:hypothetical protein
MHRSLREYGGTLAIIESELLFLDDVVHQICDVNALILIGPHHQFG